jgi:hypothetical protein
MRHGSGTPKATSEKVVKDIRRSQLDGFALGTDVEIVRYPDRYATECGLPDQAP